MAVYTKLSQTDIARWLTHYELGPLLDAQGILKGVENTNYLLILEGHKGNELRAILTLYEKRVKEEDLPFFMGLLDHLAKQGIPCPSPFVAKDGKIIQSLAEKPATIVSFLEGKEAGKIEPEHLHSLGAHMARMHKAAEGFNLKRPNALSLEGWRQLVGHVEPGADTITPGLREMISKELRLLLHSWKQPLPEGVIHADLFPDNVFFKGTELSGIIDFYFACNDYLMYEVAIVINAWCFEHQREFNITKARALLRGYHAERAITQAELDHLPVLCRGAALRFLLTRSHDWLFPVAGAQVTPHDPMEYVRKLTFHQGVKHHSEYGL